MKSTLFVAIFQPGKEGLRAPFENRNCLASLLPGELLSLFVGREGWDMEGLFSTWRTDEETKSGFQAVLPNSEVNWLNRNNVWQYQLNDTKKSDNR